MPSSKEGVKMNHEIRVYLAGGFHGDWHKYVISRCDEEAPGVFVFLNPLISWQKSGDEHKSEELKEAEDKDKTQSIWWPPDKYCVRVADIVFIYHQDYRPHMLGTGEVFEAGMAYALDKFVICVNEIDHRYYRNISRVFPNFLTLKEGVDFLIGCAWVGGGM
jgi:nucleoside 2-deoxyribosyltransferase